MSRGAFALALMAVSWLPAGFAAEPLRAEQPFASFELPLVDGSRFANLEEFRGKPVVIHYWRSDCPACLADASIFNGQAIEHRNIGFLGIAVDDRTSALRFLKRNPSSHLQAYAPLSQAQLLHRAGNHSSGLPYTVLLDSQQKMCARHLGKVDLDWLEAALVRCQK